ncbi:hypothetical protein ACSSZE_15065 [Acidithiobacillus caldus]
MTNVHPFPKRSVPKKGRSAHPAMGPEFLLYDAEGKAFDVLAHVVEAGGLFLIPALDQPEDDLPKAHLVRTIAGLEALTDAANTLGAHARAHPEAFEQGSMEGLMTQAQRARKLVRKLYDMVPSNELIVSTSSFGPELMVEYATTAALTITTRFAVDLLAAYYDPFIKTGKDKRKVMFRDFQAGFREAYDECVARMEDYDFLFKELASANRAVQKALRDT